MKPYFLTCKTELEKIWPELLAEEFSGEANIRILDLKHS